MALTKTKLNKDALTVSIDLEKLLGGVAKNTAVRETFFQLALDSLMARLDSGKNINGASLGKYSKSYINSLAFHVFGKSKTVNMQLTGDMVNDIEIKKQSDKMLEIGFGSEENSQKAYGHMTGFKGHPTLEGKVAKREWFGWSDKELEAIAKDMRPEVSAKEAVSDAKVLGLLERLVG